MGNSQSSIPIYPNSKDFESEQQRLDFFKTASTETLHRMSLGMLNVSNYWFLNGTKPDDDFNPYEKMEVKDVPRSIHRLRSNNIQMLMYFEILLQELCRRKSPLKGSGYLCVELA